MDSNGLYDIYDMWHIAWWQLPWVRTIAFVIGVLAFVGLMVGVLYLLFARRKKTVPLWQQALADLNALRMQTFTTPQEIKQGHLELAALVKRYIIARFDLPAVGATDEELLTLVSDRLPDAAIHSDLAQVLSLRETISFAQDESGSSGLDESIVCAMRIVSSTIPTQKKS